LKACRLETHDFYKVRNNPLGWDLAIGFEKLSGRVFDVIELWGVPGNVLVSSSWLVVHFSRRIRKFAVISKKFPCVVSYDVYGVRR